MSTINNHSPSLIDHMPIGIERQEADNKVFYQKIGRKVVALTVGTALLIGSYIAVENQNATESPVLNTNQLVIHQGENPTTVARDFINGINEAKPGYFNDPDGAIDELRDKIYPAAKGKAEYIEGGTEVNVSTHEDHSFSVELTRDPLNNNG